MVRRFRQCVEANRLRKAADISQDDLNAIDAGMTKCSKWEGGHDHASAAVEAMSASEEMKRDFNALEGWIEVVRERRHLVKLKGEEHLFGRSLFSCFSHTAIRTFAIMIAESISR